MNTHIWTQYFLANRNRFAEPPLPAASSDLPKSIRVPLVKSLAIFQLGESGGGTRLMRYVKQVVSGPRLHGYEQAVQLFIEEEQYHSRLLEKLVIHLDGVCLQKQWTNSVFRWLRNHFGVEFNIQILLIAELIAEAYFGAIYLRCQDSAVRICCRKILADEMRHLAFHAEFLRERLNKKPAWWRTLWRAQFRLFNLATCAVVAWDHRDCFRAIGLAPMEFARMASRTGLRFLRRLEKPHTLWLARSPQQNASVATNT
ncbi:MAG: hypothetical protein K8R87_14145 [Verrucomicrobia bacterium]|nr:hypothetical protein [Verrucomicrobiota bacterium]